MALGQVQPKPEEPRRANKTQDEFDAVPNDGSLRAIFDDAVKIIANEKTANEGTEKRKEARDDAALTAQQESARWAFWATLVAGFALLANGVAIFLVWRTFQQTRRTADAAIAAAEATQKSVAVAASVERPYVYITSIELNHVPLPKPVNNDPGDIHGVTLIFKNYGRTPAFVTRVGWGFEVTNEASLPEAPQYRFADGLTVEIVIREGETFSFPVPHNLLVIKPEQRAKVSITELAPYVWGQIRYRDFLGGVAETGFVAFQYPELGAGPYVVQKSYFRFRGPPSYTYQRYREDGSDPS